MNTLHEFIHGLETFLNNEPILKKRPATCIFQVQICQLHSLQIALTWTAARLIAF